MPKLSVWSERDGNTEENIAILVKQVRENECKKSFKKLRAYLNYHIKAFGRKYRIPGCDTDEIEQECLVALRFKAIEDFDSSRGKFKSFAILCIKRHLFSMIKGNNQQKRRVLNTSLSLDEDRSSDGGESLSLINIITGDESSIDEQLSKSETVRLITDRLLSKLSKLEREVFKLYIQRYHYDEIVEELKGAFPSKRVTKKTIDNGLVRIRKKAQEMAAEATFFEDI